MKPNLISPPLDLTLCVHAYKCTDFAIFTKEIFQGPPMAKVKFWLHPNFVCEPETFEVRDDDF